MMTGDRRGSGLGLWYSKQGSVCCLMLRVADIQTSSTMGTREMRDGTPVVTVSIDNGSILSYDDDKTYYSSSLVYAESVVLGR